MSFYLFAAGTGGYTYPRRRHADEGDAFDLGQALSRIQSLGGGMDGFVEDEVVGAASPPSGLEQALRTLGAMQCVDALRTAFRLALADAGGRMTVNVAATESNTLWPDTGGAVRTQVFPGMRTPFREFMRDIHPVLESAGLNRFRVLCVMAGVFTDWSTGGSIRALRGDPMLNFQITSD